MALICPYCVGDEFTSPSEALLLSHVRLVHSMDPNFRIQCSVDSCSRTFNNSKTICLLTDHVNLMRENIRAVQLLILRMTFQLQQHLYLVMKTYKLIVPSGYSRQARQGP